MHTSAGVRFAVVASLLLVTMGVVGGSPMRQAETVDSLAAASDGLVVVSSHSTDTEFQSQSLTNLTVSGSGQSAVVTLASSSTVYSNSFDSEAADSGLPNDFENGTTGGPESVNVTTARSIDGSQSVSMTDTDANSDTIRPKEQPYAGNTSNVSVWVYNPSSTGEADIHLAEGGTRIIQAGVIDGDLKYYDGSSFQTIATAVDAGEWTLIKLYDIDPSADTVSVYWKTANGESGRQTGISTESAMTDGYDSAQLKVYDSTGFFDNYQIGEGSTPSSAEYIATHDVTNSEAAAVNLSTVTNVSVTVTVSETVGGAVLNQSTFSTAGNKTLTWAVSHADNVTVNVTVEKTGNNPQFELADESFLFNSSAPTADSSSASPQGGVEFNDESVTVSVPVNDSDFGTAQGDEVQVEIYVDGSLIKTTNITSNQTVSATASNLANGSHSWHVELSDSYGETSTSATWSFEVRHYAPVFDNSSASPQGGTTVTERTVDLSIPVEDVDFAESSGDEVQVEFVLDGSVVATKNVTSNGTVTASVSVPDGGNHTWYARATDEYGQSATSATFEFKAPSELRIYNESSPSQLLDNASTQIRFYFQSTDDLIVTRNTTDGTLNMTGLPTDVPFVVTADAPGYQPRRIYVTSLVDQQQVYLLPESAKQTKTTFVLKDFTGKYPSSETVLVVQRAINDSWTTVEGDFFGATGSFPTHLRYNVRHRLVLINTETGERDPVGTFTPLSSGEQTVRVLSEEEISIQPPNPSVVTRPGVKSLLAVDESSVSVTVDNETADLAWWNVTIVYTAPNGSTTTLSVTNQSGPAGGTFSPTLNLTGKAGGNVTVIATWKTEGGSVGSRTEVYRIRQSYQNEHALLAVLGDLPIPAHHMDLFTTMLAMMGTVLVTAAAGQKLMLSTEQAGLVALGVLTGFSLIGWVGYSVVFVSGAAFVTVTAVRRGL